jgi:hypothetical protein
MKYHKWGSVGFVALSLLGCGTADPSTEDTLVGETSQAISFTGIGPFWWDDVVDDVASVTLGDNRLDQFLVQSGLLASLTSACRYSNQLQA